MIAADADRIKIPDPVSSEKFLDVSHHPQRKFRTENAGILSLVFFENICLNRPSYRSQGVFTDVMIDFCIHRFASGNPKQSQA